MTSVFHFGARFILSAASALLFFQTGYVLFQAVERAGILSLPVTDLIILIWACLSLLSGLIWGFFAPLDLFFRSCSQEVSETTIPKGSLFVETTALMDPRLGDLAASHFLDMRLVLASSIKQELEVCASSFDETLSHKAQRALELIVKLEGMSFLKMRHIPSQGKSFIELVAAHQGVILAADTSRLGAIESHPVCLINTLAQMMRPPLQGGELLSVKVQRLGKEPQQGVGYLDDGSMVVINGAAEFLGETVRVQVLSVKYTANGRLIFCNLPSEEMFTVGKKPFSSATPQQLFVS